MILRSIINFGEAIDSAIGVNVDFPPEGGRNISYCILRNKKNLLSVVEIKTDIQQVSELYNFLKQHLEKGIRIHVNVVGKPVLSKAIGKEASNISLEDVGKWFPGIKREDFIVQHFKNANTSAYLSLIRKEDVLRDNILLDEKIHSFSIGVQIIECLGAVLQRESINVNGHSVLLRSGEISSVTTTAEDSKEDITVVGQMVSSDSMLAYAAAVSVFIPLSSITILGLPEVLNQAANSYNSKKRLFVTARAVVLSLLIILTANALVFFWLDQKVNEAKVNLSFFKGKSEKDTQYQHTTVKMTSAYDNLGWGINRVPLFYADQIAQTITTEIQLSILEAGVLDEGVLRKDKKYSFDTKRIRIQGLSADPAALSNWLASLQNLTWISSIDDQKYQYDSRQKKGVFEFTITVK
jgi:hypothetical protein